MIGHDPVTSPLGRTPAPFVKICCIASHAVVLLIVLRATWPDPPWKLLLVGGGVLMVATPIGFYPVSKALWLAIDLVFRPAQAEDFAA